MRLTYHSRRTRWLVGATGFAASALLHIAAIQIVLSSAGPRAHRTLQREGIGANAIASSEEAITTLVFIEDPDAGAKDSEPRDPPASHGTVQDQLRVTIVTPVKTVDGRADAREQESEDRPEQSVSLADRQRHAALFGLYIAQIQARIERAWLRPRAPVSTGSFDCRIQLVQNKRGDVAEVQLQECTDDERWALSLVRAAERASPLPAPPTEAVFVETLQLSFQSAGFVPGRSEEGFEPPQPVRTTNREWMIEEPVSTRDAGT
jgi:hypothetical protein